MPSDNLSEAEYQRLEEAVSKEMAGHKEPTYIEWQSWEDHYLKRHQGHSQGHIKDIADFLGKSEVSVIIRMHELGIP